MDVFDGQIDLALRFVGRRGFHQAEIQRRHSSLRRDLQHVVFAGINPAGFQPVSPGSKFLDKCLQLRRRGRVANGRLLTFKQRARQIEHRCRLHVGTLAKHLHQLRHVYEPGEPGVEPVARAIRRKLHCRHRLAKRRCPRVEMMQVMFLELVGLEIPLHGEHLRHAVGDGRARGEHDPTPTIERLDMAHFQIHIESAFAGGLRQAGDPRHLGDVKQILEIVRLVHK